MRNYTLKKPSEPYKINFSVDSCGVHTRARPIQCMRLCEYCVHAHSKYLQKYLCTQIMLLFTLFLFFSSFFFSFHTIEEWRQAQKHTIIMTSRCDRTNIYSRKSGRSEYKKQRMSNSIQPRITLHEYCDNDGIGE